MDDFFTIQFITLSSFIRRTSSHFSARLQLVTAWGHLACPPALSHGSCIADSQYKCHLFNSDVLVAWSYSGWETAALLHYPPCSRTTVSFSPCVTSSVLYICLSPSLDTSLWWQTSGRQPQSVCVCVCFSSQKSRTFFLYTSYSVTPLSPSVKMHQCNQREQKKKERKVLV